MDSYDAVPTIAEVIKNHFGRADVEKRNEWATRIYQDFSLSRGLEDIERSDRASERDIASLANALKHLNKAITCLEEVGWHGGKALQQPAIELNKQTRAFVYGVGVIEAPSVIAEQIASLATVIEEAKERIPTDAPSVNSAFGEGPGYERKTTKANKTAAKLVARTCADAFRDLSGVRPTVRTKVDDHTAYGPFLNFLKEIFDILALKASAETWAREATKDRDR